MSLDNFKAGVMSILIIALITAAFAIGMDEFREELEDDLDEATIVNESVVWVNDTYVSLVKQESLRSCSAVYNGTNGIVILAGNYTCTEDSGFNISSESPRSLNFATTILVTYTYAEEEESLNATVEGLTGLENATSYLSTIGTLLGVSALIMIVMAAFYFIRR